jgi:hypothetical protein
MALLYPDLKDQLGINEEWLQETSADINTTEGNSDYLKQQARFSIARELFFPPEFSAEDPSKVKDWIKQSLDDSREGLFFIDDLGDHLLTVAYARLVLKQDVSYSNAGVQITDRKLLGKSAPLPERTQI